MKQLIQLILVSFLVTSCTSEKISWTIKDETNALIFPSSVISFANFDESILEASRKEDVVGEQKSWFFINVKSPFANSKIKIHMKESKFWKESTSEYELPDGERYYKIYPKTLWDYDALRNNNQPTPIDVILSIEINGAEMGEQSKTFSMRSINECLFAVNYEGEIKNLGFLFAAYINEDHPAIQDILKEGLNTGIVNEYKGYQGTADDVRNQVSSIWSVLQGRGIKYSSITETSQTSETVFSQRVRTFQDALNSNQANCVDGSVLFASILKAIGIHPILVNIPGHMFLGYYLDAEHTVPEFLETTMLGSNATFEEAVQYAEREFEENKDKDNVFITDVAEARKIVKPIGL